PRRSASSRYSRIPGRNSSASSSDSSCARRRSFNASVSSGEPTSSSRWRMGSNGAPIVPTTVAHWSGGSSKPCSRYSHCHPARDAVSVSMMRPSKSKRKARMGTAMQSTHVAILGVDVGGTFTDAVLLDGGQIRTAKVPTSERQEASVIAAAHAVGARDVERFAHGTTTATNALLERRGARTAFVGNAGFEHLLHLRRQTRAHLYRLCAQHPEPLVPLERCHGVRGRLGPEGELEPLDLDTLPDVGDSEAVAVCLLFAFRDPAHEQAVAAELRRRHPGVHVVASHELAPEFREYERASTVAADAYLAPVAARYLSALAASAGEAGLPEPLVMLSSGGVASLAEAAAHPSTILVSGPAGGVVGAGLVARRAGFADAIAFDMGGTSTDVCLLPGGRAARVAERDVGGLPIRLPTVDLHTVGAGGGSLVRVDAGGAIRVGPE